MLSEEILQLESELTEAEFNYRLGAESKLTDEEFDKKSKQLKELYGGNIPPDSILYNVGSDIAKNSKLTKVNHLKPMLSLDNTYNIDELTDWIAKVNKNKFNELLIQPKIDGISLSCIYVNGKLKQIITRGDGITGEDVTFNLHCIKGIPEELCMRAKDSSDLPIFPSVIEIRGELYMTYEEFNRINEELRNTGNETYANPRNLAAGTIRLLDKNISSKRTLNFIVHSVGEYESKESLANLEDFNNICSQYIGPSRSCSDHIGFDIVKTYKANSLEEVIKYINDINNSRSSFPYPTDGAVIKINNFEYQKELGNTNKVPRWAIAYKFETEKVKTKIKNITLQVGRTGAITPVAELEPVLLSGSIVKRATCHNIDEMISRDIRIGDNVLIEKAGEIIPYIIKPIIEDRDETIIPYVFEEKCPVCDSKAIKRKDLKHWFCSNPECPAILQAKLEHFVSRNCMNIEDISSAWIAKLIENKSLTKFEDFYHLTKHQLMKLDRMGDKLAEKIINNIQNSTYIEGWRLLHAIGIPGIGKTISKTIMRYFKGDLNLLYDACQNNNISQIDIGDECKYNLLHYLMHNNEICNLLKLFIFKTDENTNDVLLGKKICITGSFEKSREEIIEDIEKMGGKFTNSVSSKTFCLLVGDNPGSKLQKAQKLGVKIVHSINEIF